MKPTELRIGNLIDRGDCIAIVDSITREGVMTTPTSDVSNVYKANTIQPIPLTDEWLLKFGFEFDFDISYKKDRYVITYENSFNNISEKVITMWLCDCVINFIQYVHELQNLYFALTGEELTTKQ